MLNAFGGFCHPLGQYPWGDCQIWSYGGQRHGNLSRRIDHFHVLGGGSRWRDDVIRSAIEAVMGTVVPRAAHTCERGVPRFQRQGALLSTILGQGTDDGYAPSCRTRPFRVQQISPMDCSGPSFVMGVSFSLTSFHAVLPRQTLHMCGSNSHSIPYAPHPSTRLRHLNSSVLFGPKMCLFKPHLCTRSHQRERQW